MKFIRFFFISFITASLFMALNYKWGKIPPLGKFMDPFNGFWQNAETDQLKFPPQITSDKLLDEVQIKFDNRLVPHIFAHNDYDLYFAQGFVTAQHRLWQMEIQTIVASGRLSEVIGDELLKIDREQRRQGMVFGAKNALETAMKDSTAATILKAYADGFNHYLNSLSYRDFPIEYKLLDYSPEEWTPLKTCLLLKYMAKDLGGYDQDLELTNALTRFDLKTFNLLFSENYTPADEPIIPEGTPWKFKPLQIPASPKELFTKNHTNPQITKPEPDNGSNNWAVSGAKSVTGYPILANDPHLGLNLPSLWYEIQLNSKDLNVYGASLPGAPGIIIGFNDSISWGVTNAERYVKDWYKINFKNSQKNEYLFENKWLKTKKIVEEIKIKGKKPFYDTVYYTIHGPVVYDQNFYQKNEPFGYALRWIAHDPSLEILTFYYLNRAKNYKDYVNALKFYSCPAQNFVFASSSGDIALWIAGKFPLKWKDQGKFLMDGTKAINNWHDYIPFLHSPNVLNPARNFVSSANQHPTDSTYPYNTNDGDFEYYRNRRINQVIGSSSKMSVKDFMKLQNDNYNLLASENLPYLLSTIEVRTLDDQEENYFNILKKWNYINDKNSLAAPIFKAWTDTLIFKIYDEMRSDTLPLPYPELFTTMKLLRNDSNNIIFNILETPSTESAGDLIRQSFADGVKKLENVKYKHHLKELPWAYYKGTRIKHLLKTIEPFNSDTLWVGGDKGIVNALSSNHGPSWRMIVQMGPEVSGFGVYPGGQSGNPGSPYYDNFINTWAKGKYFKLNFLKSDKDQSNTIIFTQKLNK